MLILSVCRGYSQTNIINCQVRTENYQDFDIEILKMFLSIIYFKLFGYTSERQKRKRRLSPNIFQFVLKSTKCFKSILWKTLLGNIDHRARNVISTHMQALNPKSCEKFVTAIFCRGWKQNTSYLLQLSSKIIWRRKKLCNGYHLMDRW